MIHFFDHVHDLIHHSTQMYIGMLFLALEGFLVMTIVLIIVLVGLCILMILYFQNSAEREVLEGNMRISRIIKRLDVLKITGNQFVNEETC